MDLVGLLLISIVLTVGVLYATWSSWIAWKEIREHAREKQTGGFAIPAALWFQHGVTLLISFVFLGVAASLCVSLAQSERCAKAMKALKALCSEETADSGMTWGEAGHRGSFHVTALPEGDRVTGASLCYMKFDNSDLKQVVGRYPDIQWLLLSGTQIDDRAMMLLAQRDNLSALVLTDTLITDRGFAVFEGHRGLAELNLTRTAITDRSLAVVGSLPCLRYLSLCDTNVTDTGLEALKGKMTLRTLNIGGTRISDAAVTTLGTLKNLDELQIQGCRLSPEAIIELRHAIPKCNMSVDEPAVSVVVAPDGPKAANLQAARPCRRP